MPTYRKYYMTLTREAQQNGVTIKEFNKILKSSPAQYASLSAPSLVKLQTSSFPDRIVTESFTSSFQRVGAYSFADSETASIKNNIYVDKLIPQPSSHSTAFHSPESEYAAQRSTFLHYKYQSIGVQNPAVGYSNAAFPTSSWDTDQEDQKFGNWHLWWHSLPSESMYENKVGQVFGGKTFDIIAGESGSSWPVQSIYAGYTYAFDNYVDNVAESNNGILHRPTIHYNLDGTNVDLVIIEGMRPLLSQGARNQNSAMYYLHPDFYGLNGEYRVKMIDWREHGDTQYPPLYYFNRQNYHSEADGNTGLTRYADFGANYHKMMVASTAAGMLHGFASNSDIYFFPGTATRWQKSSFDPNTGQNIEELGWLWPHNLNVIKDFHNNKPINPKTGRKNPTVTNTSMRGMYQYPWLLAEAGNKSSGSFVLPTGSNSGFRIWSEFKDLIFIKKEDVTDDYLPVINNMRFAAQVHYYSGSGLGNLEEVLNGGYVQRNESGEIQGTWDNRIYFTGSVDTSTNTVSITSSLDFVTFRPKIYTGSISDFINIEGQANPKGGNYATQLTGGLDPNSHITKIVVKGKQVATGSSLWPNALHGWHQMPPYDHYGITEVWNKKSLWTHSPDSTGSLYFAILPTSSATPTSGTGRTNRYMTNHLFSQVMTSCTGVEVYDITRTLYEELADDGVIMVQAAGNDSHLQTIRSQSFGDEYYDDALFDEDLWNTYVEYDISSNSDLAGYFSDDTIEEATEYYGQLSAQGVPPHTPVRFHGPANADNGALINVGALGFENVKLGASYGFTPTPTTVGNDMDQTTNPATFYQTRGIFPAEYSNKGAGVEIYGVGAWGPVAGVGNPSVPNPYYRESVTNNNLFYRTINYNTQSAKDQYDQPHNTSQFYNSYATNPIPLDTTTNDLSNPGPGYRSTDGQSLSLDGGTSNASPRVAGIIACYLQENPNANLKDVRKWIKANSISLPTSHDPNRDRWLFENLYYTSSDPINSASFFTQIFYPNGGDWGPNPRVINFPYTFNNPYKIEGSINMDGIDLDLV